MAKIKPEHSATEQRDLDWTLRQFTDKEKWVQRLLQRLMITYSLQAPLHILDVGAAQGSVVAACNRLGHHCVGVEPLIEAINQSSLMASNLKIPIEIKHGTAESLLFPDNSFDLILANSVLEHVIDLDASLREINRVLNSGGLLWFSTTSSFSIHQGEIRGFPLFGWYPLQVKRKIMYWARDNRPHLVGNTKTPAIHWLSPWLWCRTLKRYGFTDICDRWELRRSESGGKGYNFAIGLINALPPVKMIADLLIAGVAFAARKESSPNEGARVR